MSIVNDVRGGYLTQRSERYNVFKIHGSDMKEAYDKRPPNQEHTQEYEKFKVNRKGGNVADLPKICLRPGHMVKNIVNQHNNNNSDNNKTNGILPQGQRDRQVYNNAKHNPKIIARGRDEKPNHFAEVLSKTSGFKLPNLIEQKHNAQGSDSSCSDKQKSPPYSYKNERTAKVQNGPYLSRVNIQGKDNNVEDKKRDLLGQPTKQKLELCDFVDRDIIGGDEVRSMCFGPTKITYLDYVASGRPLKSIETFIRKNVMTSYANTHTEVSYFAAQTTKFREEAREIIKESVHASENDAVIFCGSGSTGTFHKIIHALDIRTTYTLSPIVLIGPYEHHSNILPWIEIKAKIVHIRQAPNGLIDLHHLEQELQDIKDGPNRLTIGSFSAASNVTGILTDTVAVSKLLHKYNGLAFFDFACAAPYVEIDMNCTADGPEAYKDAIFISGHKFLGGPQTPGILIAKKWLFRNKVPHGVGGGTVVFVRRQNHKYHLEPEHREEGGTPAIIESIRAGLVFKLKETFTSKFIMEREAKFFRRAAAAWSEHPDILILGNLSVERLPIFSMLIRNRDTGRFLHHDFVAMVLNYLFGLQVRSGCACAALYGLELMGMTEEVAQRYENFITESNSTSFRKDSVKDNEEMAGYEGLDNIVFKPGFVRLNLPFFIQEKCLNFIIKAILMMADHGWKLLSLFDFNRKTGKWWFRENKTFEPSKSLKDMNFTKGYLELNEQNNLSDIKSSDDQTYKSFPGLDYLEILERATFMINDVTKSEKNLKLADQTHEYVGEADELRWFMLPSEAADLLNKRKVKKIEPERLPFLPVALENKLTNKEIH